MAEWVKRLLASAAEKLKGSARRVFMAEVSEALGEGGQRRVERELGWCRGTVRKGAHELRTGVECVDAFCLRGANPVEERLPHLRSDITTIVEPDIETDPTFRTTRLYRRITSKEVRLQLIEQKEYTVDEVPSEETIRVRLNAMGYNPRTVQKSKPKKKIKETDDIFKQIHKVNMEADDDDSMLRVSMDAKGKVNLGEFSRGGKTRQNTKAQDHDHGPIAKLTPAGFFLPKHDDLSIYMLESKLTADCLVDLLQLWWDRIKPRFPLVDTLVLNQDNGPECSSRRTQFIKRIIEFADVNQINIRLAYYPPYHSKYNGVERCWGVLENNWRGELLDSIDAALGFARSMTWNGKNPVVELITRTYETGVSLSRKAMDALEERLERRPGLSKWFVDIRCQPLNS